MRCRRGSVVKGDGPSTLSTMVRMSWRNDKVAESPTYTASRQSRHHGLAQGLLTQSAAWVL